MSQVYQRRVCAEAIVCLSEVPHVKWCFHFRDWGWRRRPGQAHRGDRGGPPHRCCCCWLGLLALHEENKVDMKHGKKNCNKVFHNITKIVQSDLSVSHSSDKEHGKQTRKKRAHQKRARSWRRTTTSLKCRDGGAPGTPGTKVRPQTLRVYTSSRGCLLTHHLNMDFMKLSLIKWYYIII